MNEEPLVFVDYINRTEFYTEQLRILAQELSETLDEEETNDLDSAIVHLYRWLDFIDPVHELNN